MELEQLAYDEAKAAIDRQSTALDGLRSRAGILLAAVSLATSFFSGLVLREDDLRTRVIVLAGFAAGFALLASALCVAVLWPPRGEKAKWYFNLSARGILRQLDASDVDEATAYRELALRHEANYDRNETGLEHRFRLFRAACIMVGLEALAWFVSLAL